MDNAIFFIGLGLIFLAGLTADQLGRITRLPRVSMLLLIGIMAGNGGFAVIPEGVLAWFDAVSIIALTMVAFLLGGALTPRHLGGHGREILAISIATVVFTLAIMAAGLILAGLAPGLALILGAIATATAPAAVMDVIRQSGVQNGFTNALKGIVAIDDVWGLVVFSLVIVLVSQADGWVSVVLGAGWDLGGAIALGGLIGAGAAVLTGRLKPGEPLQAEAIGIVFLTAGLSLWLEVSFLVAGMTAGAIVANFATHHDRAFNEIEHIQWPFMILFFILGGATLELEALISLGWFGILFVGLRIVARLLGGYVGARLGRTPAPQVVWFGPALLPQAGVAVGMALVAGEAFPEWASTILAFTIASTVVFEMIGPPATLMAIRRAEAAAPGHPRDRQTDGEGGPAA